MAWRVHKAQAAYLRRLSVVFANDLRLKIVTQLYMREMSASEFFREFGGGSVPRVAAHFKTLAEHGWLRYVRTAKGDGRRGGGERYYRAPKLAVFDTETWSLLPYSVRAAFSWRTIVQLGERAQAALGADTLEARPGSRVHSECLLLDQIGWERTIARVDGLFESLFEEQADARLRAPHSGGEMFLATVGLGAFESPPVGAAPVAPRLVDAGESPLPFSYRVAKVLKDTMNLHILYEANQRPVSAPSFHAMFGGLSVDNVRRRIKLMERTTWLHLTCEITGGRRRGAREQFYRATGPAIGEIEAWRHLPDRARRTGSWINFMQFAERVRNAVEHGSFDARLDRHLTWFLLRLDRQGWENVTRALDELEQFALEEQQEAGRRMARSGEEAITMTLGLLAFESPPDATRIP